MSDPIVAESAEDLRLRLSAAARLSRAIDTITAAVERADWSRASPLELIRGLERMIVLERLVMGVPMTADQLEYHLGAGGPDGSGDAADA